MKAISLWQPRASAIAIGVKSIETRHWWTPIREVVAIHAAKRWTQDEREFAEMMRENGTPLPNPLPLGAIVAVCQIARCAPTEELRETIGPGELEWGNYGPSRWGWVLQNVRPLPQPVACLGRQSFWTLDFSTARQVWEQLAGGVPALPSPELPL